MISAVYSVQPIADGFRDALSASTRTIVSVVALGTDAARFEAFGKAVLVRDILVQARWLRTDVAQLQAFIGAAFRKR